MKKKGGQKNKIEKRKKRLYPSRKIKKEFHKENRRVDKKEKRIEKITKYEKK